MAFRLIKGANLKTTITVSGQWASDTIRVFLNQNKQVYDKYSNAVEDITAGYGEMAAPVDDPVADTTTIVLNIPHAKTLDWPISFLDVDIQVRSTDPDAPDGFDALGYIEKAIQVVERLRKQDLT